MIIEVTRCYHKADYTIGKIAIDGFVQPYNTLEPFDAGLDSVKTLRMLLNVLNFYMVR